MWCPLSLRHIDSLHDHLSSFHCLEDLGLSSMPLGGSESSVISSTPSHHYPSSTAVPLPVRSSSSSTTFPFSQPSTSGASRGRWMMNPSLSFLRLSRPYVADSWPKIAGPRTKRYSITIKSSTRARRTGSPRAPHATFYDTIVGAHGEVSTLKTGW